MLYFLDTPFKGTELADPASRAAGLARHAELTMDGNYNHGGRNALK